MTFLATTDALAARFRRNVVTPPAGYTNIRTATADLPNQMPPLPAVLVFPTSGDWTQYPGKRGGSHLFTVRFYLSQTQDLPRETRGCVKWLDVLAYQLQGSVQLGGLVSSAAIESWTIGQMDYAGQTYTGIEFGVRVVTNEGWAAVA